MGNKIILLVIIFTLQLNLALAGEDGNKKIKKQESYSFSTNECFEGVSRAMFKFNHGLDKALFKPIAKGYRKLPVPIRKGTSNFVGNISSLLTIPNNILQGNLDVAGDTIGRFILNTTIGILGIFDPAASLGVAKTEREDFGQTFGVWGMDSGCYFVLPILGPTTARDAVGKIADTILDPAYMMTAGDSMVLGETYSERYYYYYKSTDGIDFRAKNIESFDSIEKNAIDLYASVKSLYLQNRHQKINNSGSIIDTQDDSDWEEIDTNN